MVEFKDHSATLINGFIYHYIQVSGRTKYSKEKSETILKGNHVALQAEGKELGLIKEKGRCREKILAKHGATKSSAFQSCRPQCGLHAI